ncbi:hypothetical protein CC78DRAFT_273281 [Lojkania enalia]|uniref:Uncharacterized protein n=1 Tax=Lojkania enalia TaxID=147567 RepID=A0A9P4K9I1_9PLEO|nr:hypothetical protein CC78DRAFT_273281 [Didymosphaeria enalia]
MVPFRSRLSREGRPSLDEANPVANPFEWQSERDQYIMTFPVHPLPSMQAPFEESMLDATGETGFVAFPNPNKNIDMRQQLLCKESEVSELEWNLTYNCHWRNHPKGKFHPLLKTVTQIAFGIHLLHQHLEKSVADVADILLKHVNELDSFLQRANEDIEGSLRDMLFRRKCLRVPMEHVNEFDRLLDDRTYRAQLLDGNVTIERTINRMSELVNDYLIDMSTFRDANHELDIYLAHIGDAWADQNDDVSRIYSAMCGNTAGWSQFLQSLVAKAEKLGVVLVQVSSYCNEIEKRCGAASRRSLIASRSSSRTSNSRDGGRSFRNPANNKPLPNVPSERSPFLSPSLGSVDAGQTSDLADPQMQSSIHASPSNTSQIRMLPSSVSEDVQEQQHQAEGWQTSATFEPSQSYAPIPTVDNISKQPKLDQSLSTSQHVGTRKDAHQILDPRTSKTDRQQYEYPSLSRGSQNDATASKPAAVRGGKEDHSPPLTGKDSAYSSASGGSFASPTPVHPRSASSQSSYPRAQFGLFPSSSPGTPKHSISGRHGALSPILTSPTIHDRPNYYPAQRAQTSLDNHNAPTRRLLKKSSLSSLKRLFSKKKHGSVETITE